VVIVQRQQKGKKSDDFKKNIKIYLLLSTKKALLFKNRDLKVELSPELSISKEYNGDLQILGSVNLKRGGYYRFENKKFVLQKSSVYFTGRPDNPILNIHLLLNRYNRRVKIYVAGEISEPSLNFSSEPVMSREQILSFILFDDENAVNSSSMVSALGGALAKSILRNIGIKIDSMVIKSGGFEIGKKISKKVTIIYDQSDRPKAILRIEHSNRLETDISVGEESQSVDITYKKEF
jgi:translocation and assembly module TamB